MHTHKPLLVKVERTLDNLCEYHKTAKDICPEHRCDGFGIIRESREGKGVREYACYSYIKSLYEQQHKK